MIELFKKRVAIILCTFILILNGAIELRAQNKKSGEIGITVGGAYYLGDLNKIPFQGTQLSAGAFYKHNFNTRYALSGVLNYGQLKGDPANSTFDPNYIQPFNLMFFEAEGIGEFNFLPFLPGDRKFDYTPYIFAGIGVTYLPKGNKPFILNIPFGIGVKYNISDRFVLSANMGMRKTFVDDIDYDYHPPTINNTNYHQYGYAGNQDWYSVFGISLSYKINYHVKCPAFD